MEGKWQQPKRNFKNNSVSRESIIAFGKLSEGLQNFLSKIAWIEIPCEVEKTSYLKKKFNKREKISKELVKTVDNMVEQFKNEETLKKLSIDSIHEEYIKNIEENLSKLKDIQDKMKLEQTDLFDRILHGKYNEYPHLNLLKDEHLSKINDWLKENGYPILSDDPDVENSLASIPIYNTAKNENHTIISFLEMQRNHKKIIFEFDEESNILKIIRNPFQKEYVREKKTCNFDPTCNRQDCWFAHPIRDGQKKDNPKNTLINYKEDKNFELPESDSDSDSD